MWFIGQLAESWIAALSNYREIIKPLRPRKDRALCCLEISRLISLRSYQCLAIIDCSKIFGICHDIPDPQQWDVEEGLFYLALAMICPTHMEGGYRYLWYRCPIAKMGIYVCMCIYVYIRIYVGMCIYLYLCRYVYMYVCIYMYIYVYIYLLYIYIYIYIW